MFTIFHGLYVFVITVLVGMLPDKIRMCLFIITYPHDTVIAQCKQCANAQTYYQRFNVIGFLRNLCLYAVSLPDIAVVTDVV